MHVTAVETYCLSVPLPRPVRTSTATISQVSEVIVKLTTWRRRPTPSALGLELRNDTLEKYGVKIG